MKRLTISGHACAETLALLIAVAWADGRLDDREKEGVRGAAQVFNLTKELRARLDELLAKPTPLADLEVGKLSPRDGAFAYVAAAWMARADDEVDAAERALLDALAAKLDCSKARQVELEAVAAQLEPLPDGKRSWSDEITRLFKSIPPLLEEEAADDFEVVFE